MAEFALRYAVVICVSKRCQERIRNEYNNTIKANKVGQAGLEAKQWTESAVFRIYPTFEDYFAAQKKGQHTKLYYDQWSRYEKKWKGDHPGEDPDK